MPDADQRRRAERTEENGEHGADAIGWCGQAVASGDGSDRREGTAEHRFQRNQIADGADEV